ncbi:MAG TPA: terminase large subunit [Stellaceae bacterium]|jgi:hypothetical protein|nr:terminase large subunit [Stellaceae bacterium]
MTHFGIVDAMDSPLLFGPFFEGSSWDRWRAMLKATFAEPMTEAEVTLFREVAERDPPLRRVKEAVFIAGRGAGKDAIASLIATHVAMTFDPRGRLRPGEAAVVMCIAVDRHQARIVMNYIKAYFEIIPPLAALVAAMDDESVTLTNGVVIEVHSNNFRAVRGRSIICAIFDEVAFWRSDDSASPDFEVHGAVTPGLGRMPGSMLVLISNAHKRAGLLYQRYKDHYGRDDDDVLVSLGTTSQFNPTFDPAIIAKALESDQQLYGAEYLSQWRDDLASYVPRELLEAAVDRGVTVRPPLPDMHYFAFGDPSGGVHDSFTAGIAHREGDVAVVDALFERVPPFNPSSVTEEISDLLKSYRVDQIVGDRYSAQWVVESFAKHGVTYVHSERDRSAIYIDCLALFTAGRARLIDNPRLVSQFAALERRTFSNGRDRVDHGRSGRDDSANSAAGAMLLAGTTLSGAALWAALADD